MPHAFDSASSCERRLASLVDALDADGDNPLLATLRELCVGAREQRRIADVLRAGLIGTVAAPNSAAAAMRPLVLIVDDSPDSRDMAAMLLETSGFDTITVRRCSGDAPVLGGAPEAGQPGGDHRHRAALRRTGSTGSSVNAARP